MTVVRDEDEEGTSDHTDLSGANEPEGAAFPRLLRLWSVVIASLVLLGWFASRQPFYRPAVSCVAIALVAGAVWWSVRIGARRGDRRHRRARRRVQRRED